MSWFVELLPCKVFDGEYYLAVNLALESSVFSCWYMLHHDFVLEEYGITQKNKMGSSD